MVFLNKIEDSVVYRTRDRYLLPFDKKEINKGYMYSVFGESPSDTGDFFARRYFFTKYCTRYFTEKKITTQIMNLRINKIVDYEEIYNESGIRNSIPAKLIIYPNMLLEKNFICEMGYMWKLINENEFINRKPPYVKADIKAKYYFDYIEKMGQTFPDYKKYLFIPIDRYVNNAKDPMLFTSKKYLLEGNILISFLRYLISNYGSLKQRLKGWKFVFVNVNELFSIDIDSTSDISIIKELFRKCRSRPWAVYSKDTNDEFEKEEELPTDTEIAIVNNDIEKEVIEKKIFELNSVGLSKETNSAIVNKAAELIKNSKEEKPATIKNIVTNTIVKNEKNTKPIETTSKQKQDTDKPVEKPKVVEQKITEKPIDEKKSEKIDMTKSKEEKIVSKTNVNDNVTKSFSKAIDSIIVPQLSASRLARLEKIQNDMEKIQLGDKTFEEISLNAKIKEIEPKNIKASTINENIRKIDFSNFEKGYNEKLFDYDLMNILKSFADKDRPLYLISLDREDTSTQIDKKYTYKAVYEDQNGLRHNVEFDLPKFVNEKFIHLNGSDKLFINQILPLPITKVSPDEVQITSSSYNKIFIHRFGRNLSSKVNKFNSIIFDVPSKYIKLTKGNNLMENSESLTTMEYDELSSKFNTIYLVSGEIMLYFNQKEILQIINADPDSYQYDKEKTFPFGIQQLKNGEKKLITIDIDKDVVTDTELSPIDFIIGEIVDDDASFANKFNDAKGGSKLVYSRATIMAKKVPIVVLLGFLHGLEPLLNRLNINYTFSDKVQNAVKKSSNFTVVKFKDGFLTYETKDFSSTLILNGLLDIPTEEYNFLSFSSKDVYYDIFLKKFGRRNIGYAFENFEQLFIDPITKDILEDNKLPTNFIDLIIYANKLLENNIYNIDGNMADYRVRSNELVNAHLYKVLAKAYEKYRATADTNRPTKLSIKKNAVLNDMFDSQLFEEYSTLNPIYEIDRMRSTSYKGLVGCNVDDAYKMSKRAYNDSMLGIFAQSTPVGGNVGISRTLSINPNITSLRGYMKSGNDVKKSELNETNMLSGAELLVPMTATHDDPQRVSMASTQSRHTIATIDSDVPLFGYGMDKVLASVVSDRFAFKAKKNGYVEEVNEKLGYMILKYEDGTTDSVDISHRQSLNTGSGFFVENKLTNSLSEGDTFKESDIVAKDETFFTKDKFTGDTIYKSGPLARVALIHGSSQFDDSTLVTQRLAERMGSYVTQLKSVKLGKNSNIYKMSKPGDNVKVGDSLLVIDESYSDDYLNKLLGKMNEEDKDDFINSARTPIKSKINGKVVDVKIYYTIPKNELSPSIQKVIDEYEKPIKTRNKKFTSAGIEIKDITSLNEESGYVEPVNGKVKGEKMGENVVLIEFYVQTLNSFSVGDKLTYGCALKGVNQSLIPLGKEPELASDPEEKIDAFLAVSGYYARMTNSFMLTLILNTLIIGAEKKIKDILNS